MVTLWSVAWLSVFVSVVNLLAICRITRLITEDTITQPFRDAVARKAAPPAMHARPAGRAAGRPARVWRYLDKLLNCPWCAGFWVSAALVLAFFRCWLGVWPTHDTVTAYCYVIAVFSSSWVSALLADWLDSPPPPKVIQLAPAHLDVTTRQAP